MPKSRKTANIMLRIEPEVKEQVESVLNVIDMSMTTALTLYLKQIALRKKIPIELSVPQSYGALSKNEVDAMLDSSLESAKAGNTIPLEKFKEQMDVITRDFN